jgi:hypothetical protein
LRSSACGGSDETATPPTVPAEAAAPGSTGPASTVPATAATDAPAATEPTVPVVTEPATTAPADTEPDDTSAAPSDTVLINSIDEMPAACVSLLEEEMKAIEPLVADIDWDNATYGDFFGVFDQLDPIMSPLDQQMSDAGCDVYQPADDSASFTMLVPIAEDVAPGAVGWLHVFDEVFGSFDETAPPDTTPADCAAALTLLQGLTDQGKTISDTPLKDFTVVTDAANAIGQCDTPEATAFTQSEAYITFVSGDSADA